MVSKRQGGIDLNGTLRRLGEMTHELSNSTSNVMNLLIRLQGELAPKEFAFLSMAVDQAYRSVNTTKAIMVEVYKMHAEFLEQTLTENGLLQNEKKKAADAEGSRGSDE